MFKLIAFVAAVLISTCCVAQENKAIIDTVKAPIDTIKVGSDSLVTLKNGKIVSVKAYASRYNPRKALLYAAILPGAGQIYNKKYWKLPLVYGGMISLISFAATSDQKYGFYRNQLFSLLADPNYPTQFGFTETQLRTLVDGYRRQRDFYIILSGFMYLLQMVDAHVDAHLKEFDLNPQLKLSLRPDTQQNALTGRTNGFTLTLTF